MSHGVSDRIKCLEGVDYEVVKHNAHFEWVTGSENAIKKLASEVFDSAAMADGRALDAAVNGLETFQEQLITKMDALVEQVAGRPDADERAKSFAVEWADACKYQVSLRYHRMGDGPDAQKLRRGFECAIKYIVVCATNLADQDDGVEFKTHVSGFVRDVIVQSIIDSLRNLKNELEALEKSS